MSAKEYYYHQIITATISLLSNATRELKETG